MAAASLAVCICAGGVALHMNMDPKPGKTVEYDIKNRAGKADAGKNIDCCWSQCNVWPATIKLHDV